MGQECFSEVIVDRTSLDVFNTSYANCFFQRKNRIQYRGIEFAKFQDQGYLYKKRANDGKKYEVQALVQRYIYENTIYRFGFKLLKTDQDHVIKIGIVDISRQKYKQFSWNSGNAICYSSNKFIYYGKTQGNFLSLQSGNGFKEDDEVIVEIHMIKAKIVWKINEIQQISFTPPILKQIDRQFVPYFEMENRGDVIEWLPHANCVENVHGNIVPINAKNGLNKKLFINKHEQNETRRESPKKDIPENTDNNDDQVPKYLQIK